MKEKDQELYQNFLKGNEKAFEELIAKYKNNMLYFIAKYVKNLETAEDIFQETILYLLENKEKYDHHYSLKTYLYLIAKSKAMDYLKRKSKIENIEDYEAIEDRKLLEEIIITKERLQKITKVMSQMSFDYQMVVYLTKIEKLSYEETAMVMGKTPRQIKTLAYYAKKKLKQLLINEGVIEMKKNKIIKLVSIVLVIGICMSGVVFAKEIVEFVKRFFPGSSEGVNIAVNHDYVTDVETNTQNADGIAIKVDSILMDDFNLAINFDVQLDEKFNVDDFVSVWLEDLRIVDEQNNIVFSTDYNNLENIGTEKWEPEYWNGYSFGSEKKGEHQFTITLSSSATEGHYFPKSKHLKISFTRLLDRKNFYEEILNKVYIGDWHFEIDVPEEFYNRETCLYQAKSCNEEGIDLNKVTATLSQTGFKISIPEVKTDKVNYEWLHSSAPKSIFDKIALQKEYVETKEGKRFEPAGSSDGDGGYSLPEGENKIINYHQTFNLTTFDATDAIMIHIFTNKGEEIIIEFERKI